VLQSNLQMSSLRSFPVSGRAIWTGGFTAIGRTRARSRCGDLDRRSRGSAI